MQNPILQAMQAVNNPGKILEQMLQNNPQIRQFYEQNKDKTPEQVAQAYGLDMNMVQQIIGMRSR